METVAAAGENTASAIHKEHGSGCIFAWDMVEKTLWIPVGVWASHVVSLNMVIPFVPVASIAGTFPLTRHACGLGMAAIGIDRGAEQGHCIDWGSTAAERASRTGAVHCTGRSWSCSLLSESSTATRMRGIRVLARVSLSLVHSVVSSSCQGRLRAINSLIRRTLFACSQVSVMVMSTPLSIPLFIPLPIVVT